MESIGKFWKAVSKSVGQDMQNSSGQRKGLCRGQKKIIWKKKKKTRKKIWKMWHIGNIWELYIKARGETCKVNIKIGQNENKCIVQCNPSETQHFASTMVTIYCGITTLHDSAKQISEVIILFTAVWKLAQWFSSSLRLNST